MPFDIVNMSETATLPGWKKYQLILRNSILPRFILIYHDGTYPKTRPSMYKYNKRLLLSRYVHISVKLLENLMVNEKNQFVDY